jgi:DSF synthase
MSSVIAIGGDARALANRRKEVAGDSSRKLDQFNVSIDYRRSAIWTRFARGAPPYISQSLLNEIQASCNSIKGYSSSPFTFRILLSEIPGIFCLGGDLAYFRYCIQRGNAKGLLRYAESAIEAIWESVSGSGYSDLFSIALVEGETQGGGFEAAVSSHVLVAEKGVYFGFPEGLFGLFPGMGAHRLISARTDERTATKIIGSAKRYSAEELFELGVIDILAERHRGREAVAELIRSSNRCELERYRSRFSSIDKDQLVCTVHEWVGQALRLSDKHLRTISYILQAQKRTSCSAA